MQPEDYRSAERPVRLPMTPGESRKIVRFILTEALEPGGSATAYRRIRNGESYETDEWEDITVRDVAGRWAGPAGTTGFAWEPPDHDEYEILALDNKALVIVFATTEEFDQADDEVAASVTLYFDGVHPDPETLGLTLVNTERMFEGAEGAKGIARYSPPADQYYIIQMECP